MGRLKENKMKKKTAVAMLSLVSISIGYAHTWSYQPLGDYWDGAWSSNSYETVDPALSSGKDMVTLDSGSTYGVGQTFNVDSSFTVARIRLWSEAYSATNDVLVEFYENVTNPTSDPLTSSNRVAAFLLSPGSTAPNTDGSAGEVLELVLEPGEYFNVSPGSDYFLRVIAADPSGSSSILTWNRNTYADPGASWVNGGASYNRDLALGLLSTTPTSEIVPEINTNTDYIALSPVADTGIQYGINDGVNYGAADGLFIREYWPSNSRQFFAYIRFDLSSITEPIQYAALRLQQKDVANYNNDITISNFRLLGLDDEIGNTSQSWDETSLTANSLGGEFTAPAATLAAGESPFYTNLVSSFDGSVVGMSEDISSDGSGLEIVSVGGEPLADWLEARRTNGGLATLIVDFPATGYSAYYLNSRESAIPGTAPELQVYTNAVEGLVPLKIWPLGDSITYGANNQGYTGGYRHTVFTNLAARGVDIKMVGSTSGNPSSVLSTYGQAAHDGHSGYSITNAVDLDADPGEVRAGIYEGVESWHSIIEAPDVILLMIGINDLNTGYETATASVRLNLLLDRLFGYYPDTRILVASLPDADPSNSYRHLATNDLLADIATYNAEMFDVVAAQKNLGRSIELVDMHAAITTADLCDKLHPGGAGYVKMGNVWADAIAAEPAMNATRLRVFLLGGQSNADGRAHDASAQPSYPDIDFYYNVNHIHDTGVEEALSTLFPGASRDRLLGPEISYGRRLADILGCDTNNTRLAIIKHAEGGTSLYSHWKAGGDASTTGDGEQYIIFQQTVANGLTALSNKYPNAQIDIEGMIWMQGETDADVGKGVEYESNLNTFIADVRATIQPELPFVIGRLSNNQSNWFIRVDGSAVQLGYVQASQDAVAAGDPRVSIFNTDDLGVNDPNDDIHFNTESQLELGKRFAYESAYLTTVSDQLSPEQIDVGDGEKDQDPDGDGVSNAVEFDAGTDAGDPVSFFRPSIHPTGRGVFDLSYYSSANRYFRTLVSTNLLSGNWEEVSSFTFGTDSMVTNSFTSYADMAFYKVEPSVP